ncbi:MAG TPA: hypothetical protein VGQ83_29770 [Polyangia bacterium]|jgi:Arc/MetJ family transcription regulator
MLRAIKSGAVPSVEREVVELAERCALEMEATGRLLERMHEASAADSNAELARLHRELLGQGRTIAAIGKSAEEVCK